MAFGPTDFDSLGVKRQWVDGSIAMLQNGIRSVENLAKYPIVFLCNVWWYLLVDIYCMYCTVYSLHSFTLSLWKSKWQFDKIYLRYFQVQAKILDGISQ